MTEDIYTIQKTKDKNLREAIMQEEMARVYCSTACTISVNGMLGANIMKFATEEQKMQFGPELLR